MNSKSTSLMIFSRLLLLSFVFSSSIAANAPDSDLPFEFNYDRGSTVIDHNVLTEAVSSDGQTVFKTNSPQPIKKYQQTSVNNGKTSPTNREETQHQQQQQQQQKLQQQKQQQQQKRPQQTQDNNNNNNNFAYSYHYSTPGAANTVSTLGSPAAMNQWSFFDNLGRYFPGMRFMYL